MRWSGSLNADVRSQVMQRRSIPVGRVTAILALLFVVACHAYGFYLISSFQDLFATGEMTVPSQTRLVLDTYKYWLLFPLLAIAGCVMIFWTQDRRGWYLLAIAVLSVLVILPLTVWAMYAPVIG